MGSTERTDRRRGLGALGEGLAAAHLERAGYEILKRNWRCQAGELDIIALNDRALIFCEVKTRVAGGLSGPAHPLESIGPAKRRRLRELARTWMAQETAERLRPPVIRFDAIGIELDGAGALVCLEHVEDAF